MIDIGLDAAGVELDGRGYGARVLAFNDVLREDGIGIGIGVAYH